MSLMPKWREDPPTVRPMLAALDEPPVVQQGLVYEPKYDGIRALVDLDPGQGKQPPRIAIYSRNGNEKSLQFPEVVETLRPIAARARVPLLLDGELIAVDGDGRPLGFQYIQGRIHLAAVGEIARAREEHPTALIVFDLLRDGDEDLRGLSLAARRLRLQERVRPTAREREWVRLSEIVTDDGRPLLARAKDEGWEGLIVKEGQSPYHSGRRSPAWRKMKLLKQQEFVVGGWTEPRQSRQYFGSLLVGYYDDDGALRWAGSVGTGFDQHELERVAKLLDARAIAKSPFADAFKTMEKAHWVKPDLVVEIRFTEWTGEGLLRQPVYLGTRTDKSAREVRREEAPKPRPAARPPLPMDGRYRRNRKTSEVVSVGKGAGKRPPRSSVALDNMIDQLTELERTKKDGDLGLPDGDTLRVTNLAKVFWSKLGITKGELFRYYVEVSPYLLPVVDDRPMVMKRFPNGVDKPAFYQQRHPDSPPPGVRREVLPDDIEPIDEEGPRDRLIGGWLKTLLYMTQIAAISQDPWFSRVSDPLHQDYAGIDLDPGEGAGLDEVLAVARYVKEELDRLGIPGVPKTSGSRGIHIYVPLPPRTTYETGQLLCHVVASIVSTKYPKIATIERMVKKRRRGTVYVDYLQNILGKTLATAYSARASDYAGVSTPLTWKEIKAGVDPRDFTIRTAPARFKKVGDLWAPLREGKPVDIKAVLKRVEKLAT
jgi:bifunctional non-homologous end joining protein LigD